MSLNSIPKFGKVELLLRDYSKAPDQNVTKHTFDDCGLMITGDYIVVVIDERNDFQETITSTGNIFPLKDVKAYKTYAI